MKQILVLSFTALVSLNFCGCGEEPAKTAEYYEQNIELAKKRFDECKNMQTRTDEQEKDCANVKKALFRNSLNSPDTSYSFGKK
ncbi:EexN family lipoprotein [Campylobacter sp. VBCF_06 NA8]|uniref:EexN family lipoprotein n=1 Tax=Campylobacter sp. VBCF_06 NA8 TaxID=2983822 RepID=UPI0022E9A22D|nr:EexN family lipoprotein [Campylobacter sp. VBCF_06 NA8]MDA3045697.1 EexN family lipoprotein [Campylobacter sp. VBCF_06 NA8]